MKKEKTTGRNYTGKIILHDKSPPFCRLHFITKNLPIMKNLILLLALLLFKNAYAQLDKGVWLVGGSGSFYSYKEDYSTPTYNQTAKYTSIDLAASLGYFIADKFTAGLRPSFSSYKGKVISASVGSGGSTNSYRLAIGPFARYYFLNADKPFNILADVSYQFGYLQQLGALHEKGKNNTFSLMGGTEIFFNNTAGLEILLGYTQKVLSIENSPGAFKNNKNGFQVSIGFSLHLEKL
jgi:hypothetical protein